MAVAKVISSATKWDDVSRIVKYYAFKMFTRNCLSRCIRVPANMLSGYELSETLKQSLSWHKRESSLTRDEELAAAYKDVALLLLTAAQEIDKGLSGHEKFEVDVIFPELVEPRTTTLCKTDCSMVFFKHKTIATIVEVKNDVKVNLRDEDECAVARLLLQAYYRLESTKHGDRRLLCILTDMHTWHCFCVNLEESLEITSFITLDGTQQLACLAKVLCLIVNTVLSSPKELDF